MVITREDTDCNLNSLEGMWIANRFDQTDFPSNVFHLLCCSVSHTCDIYKTFFLTMGWQYRYCND